VSWYQLLNIHYIHKETAW